MVKKTEFHSITRCADENEWQEGRKKFQGRGTYVQKSAHVRVDFKVVKGATIQIVTGTAHAIKIAKPTVNLLK